MRGEGAFGGPSNTLVLRWTSQRRKLGSDNHEKRQLLSGFEI